MTKERLRQFLAVHPWWKGVALAFVLWALMCLLFGTSCGFRILFGIPCPFCGMTRALWKLLHFDFAGAWAFQPMLFPTLACIVFLLVAYITRRRALKTAAIVTAIACFCACTVFYLWKMATVFPDAAPYVHDEHTLLRFLWERFRAVWECFR